MFIVKPPIEPNSIITFRVITGETLIARLVSRTSDFLTITKPICANPTQTETGFGIFYSPFCATVDEAEEFRIPAAAILFEPLRPRKELEASYIKMTTGLEIPQ
jgi:hypothetical protein